MKNVYLLIHKFYFPFFLIIALLIYVAQKASIVLPVIVRNYANDFFCLPIVLFVCQRVTRFIKSDEHVTIPLPLLIMVTLFYSWYFEWFLPMQNTRYTTDWVDVFLYFLGLIFFYVIEYRLGKKGAF